MQHKVVVTVIDKKLYPELQEQYCIDPEAGPCPVYNVGDTFVFERYGIKDDFWHIGLNTLKKTDGEAAGVAGGTVFPHCSEAWDAIARYIYAASQGGSVMRQWMRDERQMIACCSDGTRPVIFRIERVDYKPVYLSGERAGLDAAAEAISSLKGVARTQWREDYLEVYVEGDVSDALLRSAAQSAGATVTKID